MYHYIQSEECLWTVGTGTPRSQGGTDWEPESDHGSEAEAAARVHWLNGGCDHTAELAELRKEIEQLTAALQDTRNDIGP